MRISLLFTIGFLLSFPSKAEEKLSFFMTYENCITYSTHIFKGKILDEKGTVKILEILKGKTENTELHFKSLTQKAMGNYGPKENYKDWEVILFLRKIDDNFYPIKFYAETEDEADWDFNDENDRANATSTLPLSLAFSKNGKIYYSIQRENPGDLIFGEVVSETLFRKEIKSDLTSLNLSKEIKQLKSKNEIEAYWKTIRKADQQFRGLATKTDNDNLNFKKTILMIKQHGYPSKKEFGYQVNITPNFVFSHQASLFVQEQYFAIFYDAYQKGLVDTTEFLINLRGMHRAKWDRDLIRGRDLTAQDIPTLLESIGDINSTHADYGLFYFETTFEKFETEVEKITSGELSGSWKTERNHIYSFFKKNGQLYVFLKYRNGSHALPQRIHFNSKKSQYEYSKKLPLNDYFQIDRDGNLLVTKENKDLEYRFEYSKLSETTYAKRKVFYPKTEKCLPVKAPDLELKRLD